MRESEEQMMAPVHPGTMLQEDFLVPLEVSASRLARAIGVPPRRVNEVLRGNRRISADMALRLARFFGLSDEFWARLQGHYDVEVEKGKSSLGSHRAS